MIPPLLTLRARWRVHAVLYPVCIRVWCIPPKAVFTSSKSKQNKIHFACDSLVQWKNIHTPPPPAAFSPIYASNVASQLEAKLQWRILPFSPYLKANWNIKIQLKRMYCKRPRLSFYRLIRIQTPLPRRNFSQLFAVKCPFRFQTTLVPQDLGKDMNRPGTELRPPRWDASTLEKSQSNSLFIVFRNIYCAYELATSGECSRHNHTVPHFCVFHHIMSSMLNQ